MRDITETVLESVKYAISREITDYRLQATFDSKSYINCVTRNVVLELSRNIWAENLEPIKIQVPEHETYIHNEIHYTQRRGDHLNKWEMFKEWITPKRWLHKVNIKRHQVTVPYIVEVAKIVETKTQTIDVKLLYPDIQILTDQTRAVWTTLGLDKERRVTICN